MLSMYTYVILSKKSYFHDSVPLRFLVYSSVLQAMVCKHTKWIINWVIILYFDRLQRLRTFSFGCQILILVVVLLHILLIKKTA